MRVSEDTVIISTLTPSSLEVPGAMLTPDMNIVSVAVVISVTHLIAG